MLHFAKPPLSAGLQECPILGTLSVFVLSDGRGNAAGRHAPPAYTAALFSSGLLAALQQGVAIETTRAGRSAQVIRSGIWQTLLRSLWLHCRPSPCLWLVLLAIFCGCLKQPSFHWIWHMLHALHTHLP